MKKFYCHPYHLVSLSPWPLLLSLSLMILMIGLLKWLTLMVLNLMLYGMLMVILVLIQWWRDVIREGVYIGFYTMYILLGMKLGMILFIMSELMFFISFFWTYFHMFLSPSVEIGLMWEPKNIYLFNFMGVPLLNTMILLTSGIFLTWSHIFLMKNKKYLSILTLILTIMLGMLFTYLQLKEYNESFFCMNDSVYGSIFFLLTGFHGIHVLIGTIFMIVVCYRMLISELLYNRHVSYEFCVWYWHFVDLVWLILYILLYCLLMVA